MTTPGLTDRQKLENLVYEVNRILNWVNEIGIDGGAFDHLKEMMDIVACDHCYGSRGFYSGSWGGGPCYKCNGTGLNDE